MPSTAQSNVNSGKRVSQVAARPAGRHRPFLRPARPCGARRHEDRRGKPPEPPGIDLSPSRRPRPVVPGERPRPRAGLHARGDLPHVQRRRSPAKGSALVERADADSRSSSTRLRSFAMAGIARRTSRARPPSDRRRPEVGGLGSSPVRWQSADGPGGGASSRPIRIRRTEDAGRPRFRKHQGRPRFDSRDRPRFPPLPDHRPRSRGTKKPAAAVCCLIPSVVLLHAVCLPPLQGADETSHGATIEALLFRGMPVREGDPYPRSWSLAATWLDQDRVQYQPEEPLPVDTPVKREALARNFLGTFQAEAKEAGTPAPAAEVQGVDRRAPFFFRPFSLAGPLLRPLPVLERISAYRVLSALSGLLLFCAGALLLQRAGPDAGVVLSYGLVWLVPYMVFAVASISNYATAIGLGSLLAACALVLILSERRRERGAAAGLLVAGSWLGIPLWPDFVLLAPVATIAVAIGAVLSATKGLSPARRRFWRTASLASGAAFLLTSAVLLFRIKAGNIGTRMPREMPGQFDRSVFWMIVVTVAPTIISGLLAFGVLRLSRLSADRQRRVLTAVSIALATVVLFGFFLTPWTSIPYETDRYWFSKLFREGIKVALSNSFSWDQDVLFWKFSLGAGGWHDILLPDAIYASSRWLAVAALALLPRTSRRERPD